MRVWATTPATGPAIGPAVGAAGGAQIEPTWESLAERWDPDVLLKTVKEIV